MKCERKRSLFDLLEVYNCEGCEKQTKDELFVINNITINIYYSNPGCKEFLLSELDYIYSKRVRLFLKDAIINQSEITILWIDEFNYDKDINNIYKLLSFGKNIHIMSDK